MNDLDCVAAYLSAMLVEWSAYKIDMAGVRQAIMKDVHGFNGHILVLIHFPIGPVIESEATELWQLAEDFLVHCCHLFNFNRFFILPSIPQTLWDLLEGRNAYVLLNLWKTITEMNEERKNFWRLKVVDIRPNCLRRMANFPLGDSFTFI